MELGPDSQVAVVEDVTNAGKIFSPILQETFFWFNGKFLPEISNFKLSFVNLTFGLIDKIVDFDKNKIGILLENSWIFLVIDKETLDWMIEECSSIEEYSANLFDIIETFGEKHFR